MDDRKAAILRAVVEEYIETAQPVGSAHVARRGGIGVSPATVRNEMTALEQEGFLHQPHISAGRVPTDKGYRFFVDTMVEPGVLDLAQRREVSSFFASAHGALEEMLRDTTRLLSNLTDCAAVVVAPSHEDARIRSVQVVGIGGRSAVVVVVLSNGGVEKATIDVPDGAGDEHLAAATALLTRQLGGSTVAARPVLLSSGEPVVDQVATAAVAALASGHDAEVEPVFVGGASRMATAFDAVETVRSVLAILEQQYLVVTLLRDVLDRGLRVAIGTEHGVEPLAECSVVVAPYEVEGERVGTVGVLGPTRMHYPQALAAVAVVSSRLSRSLREG